MRPLLVALLLLASLTAGCMGGDEDEPPDPPGGMDPPPPTGGGGVEDPDPPEPITEVKLLSDFVFDACSGVLQRFTVDHAAASELVHEDYVVPTTGAPAGPAQAIVHAQLYNCTSFTAGSYAFEHVQFGMLSIPVDAPADGAEADQHAYIVEMLGASDVLGEIWPAAGFTTYRGNASQPENQLGRSMELGGYTLEVYSQSGAIDLSPSNTFAWYHELDNGDRLTWTGERAVDGGSGGAANLALAPESPYRAFVAAPATPPFDQRNLAGEGAIVDDASFTSMFLVQELAAGRE